MQFNKQAQAARERGIRDYEAGLSLDQNAFRYFANSQGAISLMAQWDAGWKIAELKDKDPEQYKKLMSTQ